MNSRCGTPTRGTVGSHATLEGSYHDVANEHIGIESYAADVKTIEVVAALKRDGAVIIRNQVEDQTTDAVLAELREPFDKVGRCDEDDFNGYKTLRVSGILAVSPTSADLVGHPRVLEIADAILLANCLNYRIGSLTGIEIHPGEMDQDLTWTTASIPSGSRTSRSRSAPCGR